MAQPSGSEKKSRLTFQFKNADLDTVIKSLARSLGLTFIVEVSDRMAGKKIDAVSDKPVPRDQGIAFLNSALIRHGVAAVPVGKVIRVVTIEDARRITHRFGHGADPAKLKLSDELIVQTIPLKALDASGIKKELGALTSATGQLLISTQANVLVLIDTESNVKRFLTIISRLDTTVTTVLQIQLLRPRQPPSGSRPTSGPTRSSWRRARRTDESGQEVRVIKLRNAAAGELERVLEEVFKRD